MHDQDTLFRIAYGEAMFYAHLIEDLVAMHIFECGYFHVNGYSGLSRSEIRNLAHSHAIQELGKIYHNQTDGSIQRLITSLDLLNKIRNKLTHAFIPQVGTDFRTEEGRDQILALLQNIVRWEKTYFRCLQTAHRKVISGAITRSLDAALEREDPPFDARVARSNIQDHLNSIARIHES